MFREAIAGAACQVLNPTGYVYVSGHGSTEAGWWKITGDAATRLTSHTLTHAILSEIAPLAYGRAGFDPDALIVVAHDAGDGDMRPHVYATAHVEAGAVLLELELAASRQGMSFMCHYGVTAKMHEVLSLIPDKAWMMGAISLGTAQ
jgi:hypothetical protein